MVYCHGDYTQDEIHVTGALVLLSYFVLARDSQELYELFFCLSLW